MERNHTVLRLPTDIESAKAWAHSSGSFSANALGFIGRLQHCWRDCVKVHDKTGG